MNAAGRITTGLILDPRVIKDRAHPQVSESILNTSAWPFSAVISGVGVYVCRRLPTPTPQVVSGDTFIATLLYE